MANSGLVPQDSQLSNLNVTNTLVANKVVARDLVVGEINANAAHVTDVTATSLDVSRLNASEYLLNGVPFSGGSAVPGSADEILTSTGANQMQAPGSTLSATGILNINGGTSQQLQFAGTQMLSSDAAKTTTTVGPAAVNNSNTGNIAIGYQATNSSSGNSIALGSISGVQGTSAVAVGFGSNAVSTDSIAIGTSATAGGGTGAIAIGGGGATASGQDSVALGNGAQCTSSQLGLPPSFLTNTIPGGAVLNSIILNFGGVLYKIPLYTAA